MDKGSTVDLVAGDDIIGKVWRSRTGVRPLCVSVVHRIGLDNAVRLIPACCTRYRRPEPIRAANRLAGQSSAR